MLLPKERLIFALDVSSKDEALELVRKLGDEVGLFKVGLELYLAYGPDILYAIGNELEGFGGAGRIFLDLKLYDIPATLRGAMNTILHGVLLTTIPSDIGPTGLQNISRRMGSSKILAVTVLTSMTAVDLEALGFAPKLAQNPVNLVVHKAKMAQQAGCAGVVCSGREARAVREACGEKNLRGEKFLIVCPGIRPAWASVPGDDQKRIVTPAEAIRNGADYIVVGRPISQSEDKVAAARKIVAEIEAALQDLKPRRSE